MTSPCDGIAIIGMACRFPGAGSVEAFWNNLRDGVESISFFSPEELRSARVDAGKAADPNYVRAGAVVEGADLFDASFFGISTREAEIMDPQHRLFLECAWEALEDAGYDASRLQGQVGVYAGANRNTYLINNLLPNPQLLDLLDGFQIMIGSDNDFLATRVSYKLNLTGPSVTVQTASSTSLVAIHLACQGILAGECDVALAGGAAVRVPQKAGYLYKPGGARSADGHTKAFDAGAHGTVFGSGVGVVVLKPLRTALTDGDQVHAVIRGSAVNNDGAAKRGYTAPSLEGLSAVITRALSVAGVEPDTVSYIEAHGTGTEVGDPVELGALTQVFRRQSSRSSFCAIGSVKTNIGHPTSAAGVAAVIKTALSLAHQQLPPSLNFQRPNPSFDLSNSPFYVNTSLAPWRTHGDAPRRAGVNGMGFGGTNAHVVLEEAPARPESSASRPWQLVTLSARTTSALESATRNLARHLRLHPELNLADVAHTLQLGRREFTVRRTLACRSVADAAGALESLAPRRVFTGTPDQRERPIVFMFPGHGSQHVNMMLGLYQAEPLFRRIVNECSETLVPLLGIDLRGIVYPVPGAEEDAAAQLRQTLITQPALFVWEYALARLWMEWGIRPQAVIGYSIGDYAAACVAGIFSIEDALTLVAARARLAESLPVGAMLAVALDADQVQSVLGSDVSLAAMSGTSQCILAGPPATIEATKAELAGRGVSCKSLPITRAFHSQMVEPVLELYREAAAKVCFRPPSIGVISGVTGTWMRPEEPLDPDYWVREVRETVRFSPGVQELAKTPGRVFLEIGPSYGLSALVRGHRQVDASHLVIPSCRNPQGLEADLEVLLGALGKVWSAGSPVEWAALSAGERRHRVVLPTYPFERERYWIEPPADRTPTRSLSNNRHSESESLALSHRADGERVPTGAPSGKGRGRPGLSTPYVAPATPLERKIAAIWSELLGTSGVGANDWFFELGGDSLTAVQLISRVREACQVEVPLSGFLRAPTIRELAISILALSIAGRSAQHEVERRLTNLDRASAKRCPPANPRLTEADPAEGATGMQFSVFFFSGDESAWDEDKYRLVIEGAKFADRHGFTAVWTPERHFDKFGGLYPNPAVLSAALATVTERLQIRAGSVVVPLHDPIRIAEEWSLVDNLSKGRTGLAFAPGFHPRDFVLAPESFADRKERMFSGIDLFRRLWRGESVRRRAGNGGEIEVRVFPRPIQIAPPIWLASVGSPETFVEAGRLGANVLTALLRLRIEDLAERIQLYRESLLQHGHDPQAGKVTLMVHTFLGTDVDRVRAQVAGPFAEYLRSHLEFIGPTPGSKAGPVLSEQDKETLLTHAFERYYTTGSLIGTVDTCLPTIDRLEEAGVDEVACLIDFGVDIESTLESLHHLNQLRLLVQQRAGASAIRQ